MTAALGTRDRLVVGVDGTPGARSALAWAISRAADTGAAVVAVTVFEGPDDTLEWRSDVVASERHLALSALHDVVTSVRGAGAGTPRVEEAVRRGRPAAELVEAARGADMLVLGHSNHHLPDAMLGSTVTACLRAASCPVLVVPGPAHQT